MIHLRLLLILLGLATSVTSSAANKDSVDVAKAANAFVTAFNNFDWPTFKNAFTRDATIYFPTWDNARRVSGTADIEAAWTNIFPEFKDPNNRNRLHINPKDIQIQLYGEAAVVTFHLGNGKDDLGRRTLVMIKENKAWKIAHLHASIVSNGKSN